jgi:hypothetical protein
MAVQRLTVAYRSRPRPSSSPGAKASTVCPYYLDGEQLERVHARAGFYLHYFERSRCQRSARPSAVFKVHGGEPTGVSRRLSLRTEQRNSRHECLEFKPGRRVQVSPGKGSP